MTETTEVGQFTDHFTNPPGRRIGALALILDERGRVLLVQKSRLAGQEFQWGLIGGCAESGEHLVPALERHLARKTGLTFTPGRLLVVDHVPANEESAEGFNFVFYGGVVDSNVVLSLSTAVTAYQFVSPPELEQFLSPLQLGRVVHALDAHESGWSHHLVSGVAVSA